MGQCYGMPLGERWDAAFVFMLIFANVNYTMICFITCLFWD
jgi:hypothetical protein